MQFDDGIARPNEYAGLEQDIALSATHSDTEDALDIVGIFMHTVTTAEQPIERLDRRFGEPTYLEPRIYCRGAPRQGRVVHYDRAHHIPFLLRWGPRQPFGRKRVGPPKFIRPLSIIRFLDRQQDRIE